MPGRAGLRMLLWISAAGLAGAGWFGWLVWQDYDWTGTAERAFRRATPGSGQVRSSTDKRGVSPSKAYTGNSQTNDQSVDTGDNDLLGHTTTRWNGARDLTNPYNKTEEEADNQQHDATSNRADEAQSGHSAHQDKTNDEDFVAVEPSMPVGADPEKLALATLSDPEPDAAREDFVVVPFEEPQEGISPFLATAAEFRSDEDFVVATDSHRYEDEESEELPEVDLTDYVDSWTPIVPKIAALISHELWPQLRTYLESLPQFGDTNLERVVNAVAGDVGIETADPGGVGEGPEGFAFYASLFEEMAQEPELIEA